MNKGLSKNDEIALRKFVNYWYRQECITKKNENGVWLSLLRWLDATTAKVEETGDCDFYFDGGKITEPIGDPALVEDWKRVVQKMMSYGYGQKDPEDWNRWLEMWEQWEPEHGKNMTLDEFRERYNRTAVSMVIKCFEKHYETGSDEVIEKICDHELEPGKFVARAFYDSAHDEVIYEEYYYIDDPEKLTPKSTPDVYHHVEIPEDFATRATLRTYLSENWQIDKINEIDKAITEVQKEAKEFKFYEHTIETEEGLVVVNHNQHDDDFARVEIYKEMESEDDYNPQMAPVPDTTIYVWYEKR